MPVMSLPSNKPMKVLVVQEVSKVLQSLRAGQRLMDICISRLALKPYFMDAFTLQYETVRNVTKKAVQHKLSGYEMNVSVMLSSYCD